MEKVFDKIKTNRFYINYKRMWPYVKPVWFRALCSMLIGIPIGSLDAIIARFSYVYGFTKYYPNTAFLIL